jgi:mercuric ion transport protein
MIRGKQGASVQMTRTARAGHVTRPVSIGAGLAAAGGVAGGLAASACCILPLVMFSLGAGGVWIGQLAALSPYQPYFIGFAVLAIGYGHWRIHDRPAAACAEGEACARPLPRRLVRAALWTATGLVVAALIYPYAIPHLL